MSKVIIFAGTTEGRKLSEWLCQRNVQHTVCVATDYGEQVLTEHPCTRIHQGRMDALQMKKFIGEQKAEVVIDATHPYASVVTENLKKAAQDMDVTYLRLERENIEGTNGELKDEASETNVTDGCGVLYFKNIEDCELALRSTEGNIMLTTGSKELAVFCQRQEIKSRLIVRVLPGKESISICENQNIQGKNIIAMQGPFSVEMNLAFIHQYNVKVLVTKASGAAGGFAEKLEAARQAKIPVYIIGRPKAEKGFSFKEVCSQLEIYVEDEKREAKAAVQENNKTVISLIGCGMGHRDGLTMEALEVLEKAQVVFGASRLLKDMEIKQEQYAFYLARDIIPYLQEHTVKAAILFSGDTGFYSGAKKMYEELQKAADNGTIHADIRIYPGISSLSNLAAMAGESWEDAKIMSVHGKGTVENWGEKLLRKVRKNRKSFILLSGVADLQAVGKLLLSHGLTDCSVIAGYQMSYKEQEILELSLEECIQRTKEGLYSLFIINETIQKNVITSGIRDEEFIRGKVPMTKEEVRTVSISKLGLWENAVVYDIGSGTGSVAVEIARLSETMQVYAIERKLEAVELIQQNVNKFGLENVFIIKDEAPKGLRKLPTPTHAFIGGTGGHMQEILKILLEKNPEIHIVANAVSFETLQEFLQIEKSFPVEDFQIVTLSATRTKKLENYHMMQSENPVFICSFQGKK